jgi:hypothetical protein
MVCTWRKVLRPRRRSSRANHLQELERPLGSAARACGSSSSSSSAHGWVALYLPDQARLCRIGGGFSLS